MSAPVLVKVGASLLLILLTQKITRSLLAGICLASLVLALWAGHTLPSALATAAGSIFNSDSLMLLLVVTLVLILSSQMSKSGMMAELVTAVQTRLDRRASVAVLPALIGLLPMPGGALFSAPLVDDCDRDGSIAPIHKTAANYWFRHIWEFWWPIYPGALLAIELSGLQIWQYILVMFPLSLVSILAGYIFILRRIPRTHAPGTETNRTPLLPLISPILIVMGVYLLIQLLIPQDRQFSRYLPMAAGLAVAVVQLQLRRPLSVGAWKESLLSYRLISMVAIIAAVRIYGTLIEAPLPDGSRLMDLMRMELDTAGIPVWLLIAALPFTAAMTTGISVGFVGASFPVVLSLIGPDPTVLELMQLMPFAYGIGYLGMIISPVHVCLVVSNEHFRIGMGASLRYLLPPVLLTAAGICAVGGLWLLA